MGKVFLTVLSVLFALALVIYSATASGITFLLHLFLLIVGTSLSVLTINGVTKSSNSLKSKIYFSFVLPPLVFLSIIFFSLLGDHKGMDEYGVIPLLFITSSLVFLAICLVVGLTLSVKRKSRRDFEYNLNPSLWIISIVLGILLILLFYNIALYGLALSTKTKTFCKLMISSDALTPFFSPGFKEECLLETSIKESESGEIVCGEIKDALGKNACYSITAKKRGDIKICVDNVIPEGIGDPPANEGDSYYSRERKEMSKYYECSSTIRYLEGDLYEILKDPQHPDVVYAVRSTPELGIHYDPEKGKYLPLVENVAAQGGLDARKAALDILIRIAESNPLEEEKRILREEVLPLIGDDPELQEYTEMINQRLSAVILVPESVSVPVPDSLLLEG